MDPIDIAVVGAGPCGIAVGAAAHERELKAVLFDKGCVAASLVNYPHYMRFFSTSDRLEVGGVPFAIPEKNPSRLEALVYYRRVAQHFRLDIRQYQSVESISGSEGSFTLKTRKMSGQEQEFEAKRIVMATGGFHAPNMLEVPGEDLPNVLHYYREPHPFFDQDVLVVGGSNSAVEASGALPEWREGHHGPLPEPVGQGSKAVGGPRHHKPSGTGGYRRLLGA